MRGDPVGHIAAVGATGSGHARAIDKWKFFQRIIHAVHHVDVSFAAPVVGDFVGKLLAVAG